MTQTELDVLKKALIASIKGITVKDIESVNLDNMLLYDDDEVQLSLMLK